MWSREQFQQICQEIDRLTPQMVEMQCRLVALPAISPKSGGEGEKAKADYLKEVLTSWAVAVEELRAPDPLAPCPESGTRFGCGYRPNLVAILPGRRKDRVLWIITHLDVVPPGPRELWDSDPFIARVEGERIYGRGVEDNQQEMVASIFAVRALLNLGLIPKMTVGLLLVADEETGSEFGVDWLLKNHPNRVSPPSAQTRIGSPGEGRFDRLCEENDLVLVPDAGNEEGTLLEVAEKSILWLKFITFGEQAHGSTPQHGKNAHRAGANLLLRLDKVLHERFNVTDELFSPPVSTIEPTKKEANVPNINTIPGEDVFYFDCRILPQYRLEDVLAVVKGVAREVEGEFGVKVNMSVEQQAQAAPKTPVDAPVVRMLGDAVREVIGKEPFAKGIGGGTVAAFFRRLGVPTVVWGRNAGQAHKPNEFCLIPNMVGNAKVYAHMMGQEVAE